MSNEDQQDLSTELTEDSDDLSTFTIARLRTVANLHRIPFSRDSTKLELIAMIEQKQKQTILFTPANTNNHPKPGFTRIKVMRDPTTTQPVWVCVNGRNCTIPRSVECDVPEKIVEALRNSVHPQVVEDQSLPFNDPARIRIIEQPSYPFEVLDRTPGPDPWPGFEVSRMAAYRPRERFWKKFGRWPKRGELNEAVKSGIISLAPEEQLPGGELREPAKRGK